MIKPALLAAAGMMAYLAISQPDRLVVEADGGIKGMANKARAMLQQDRFWRQQRDIAHQRAGWIEQDLDARGDPVTHMDDAIRDAMERAEEVRQDYPEMDRARAMEAADVLRSMADAIMESHWEVTFYAWDEADLEDARSTLRHIEGRL